MEQIDAGALINAVERVALALMEQTKVQEELLALSRESAARQAKFEADVLAVNKAHLEYTRERDNAFQKIREVELEESRQRITLEPRELVLRTASGNLLGSIKTLGHEEGDV